MSEFDPLCANCGKAMSAHRGEVVGEPGPTLTEPDEHGHRWPIVDCRPFVLMCPTNENDAP